LKQFRKLLAGENFCKWTEFHLQKYVESYFEPPIMKYEYKNCSVSYFGASMRLFF
jgi:hypothetical protein